MKIDDLYERRRIRLQEIIDSQFDGVARRFCKATEMSASYVNRMLSDPSGEFHKRIGETLARKIEGKLKVPAGFLDIKFGEPVEDTLERMKLASSITTGGTNSVPLLDWRDVSASMDIEAKAIKEWVPCIGEHSPQTFAVRVRGDSMVSPQRSYPDGAMIFVDPDVEPDVGDRVVADVGGRAAFRVLDDDGGHPILKPLSTQYRVIDSEFSVIGTVIGTWIAE